MEFNVGNISNISLVALSKRLKYLVSISGGLVIVSIQGVAYNSNINDIYVTNSNSNSVSVISPTNAVIATIPVGNGLFGVAYDSNNNDMYETNFGSNSVSVINPSNAVIATIPVGSHSSGVAYNSNNRDVYVDNNFDRTVSVIAPPPIANAGTNQTVQSFQTVQLNGGARSDPSGFTPLTYQWTQTSSPTVSLSISTSTNPSFVVPLTASNVDLTFQLIVTNSKNVQSNPSNVTITVTPSSSPIPPSNQNGIYIPNSNINSFNNGRFLNHNNITTYDFGSHGGNSFAMPISTSMLNNLS